MRTRDRVLPFLSLFLLCSALCVAQTPAKETTASVSGRVTISGKSAPGITVVATMGRSMFESGTVAKTVTDEDGNYKLTGLAAGSPGPFDASQSASRGGGSEYNRRAEALPTGSRLFVEAEPAPVIQTESVRRAHDRRNTAPIPS